MKKLIGGLLVVAILTSPSFGKIDYISYEFLKLLNQKPLYVVINYLDEEDFERLNDNKIYTIMDDLDKNTGYINDLIKERDGIIAKIETKMDLYSRIRKSFSEKEIEQFVSFVDFSGKSKAELKNIMHETDSFKNFTKEILHIEADYDMVYNELTLIQNHQNMAIENLNNFIDKGNDLLKFI